MKKLITPFLAFVFAIALNAQTNSPEVTTATAGKLAVTFSTNAGSSNGTAMALAIYITDSSGKLVNTLLYRTSNGDSSAKDMTTWWSAIGSAWSVANTKNHYRCNFRCNKRIWNVLYKSDCLLGKYI